MLCPLAIVVLLLAGAIEPWMIIVLSVVVGVTDALSMPSFQSIVPSIVERDQIGRGLALNSTQFSLSRILGPSIAGVLMASAGAVACFVVSVVSYLPFIGVALWILPRWKPPTTARVPQHFRHTAASMTDTLREPHSGGGLLTVFSTGLLCSPLFTFSPVLVKDVFHGDASHFSMAAVAFGAGGIVGGLGLLGVAASVDRRRISAGFAIGYGFILVLTALNPWGWGVVPLFVLAGIAMTVSGTAANTLLQATANPLLLGQTVSLFLLAMRGGISLGALLTGISVSLMGVRQALLLNGLMAIVVQGAIAWKWLRSPVPETPENARP